MNILFLSRRFYPDIGGVEKHVFEISKILIKKGNKVTVVTESQGKEKEIEGIKITRIPNFAEGRLKKFYIWSWFYKNRNLIKDSDVIHIHDVFYWYLPTKLLFLSKKNFITFHGYESYPIRKKAIIIRKISEKLSKGNIIVGDFIKKWYYTNPNFVIYGGVHLPKSVKRKTFLRSASFIGRLDYHTNVLSYAKTVDIVRSKYPDFKFVLVGDGEDSKKLRKYKPLGFKKNPLPYLKNNNFAFVSRYLSILEAFAYKSLVFAFYDNEVKEDYLKMSPFAKFIIIEKTPEEMAKKIVYYMDNKKEADKLVEGGYNWVKEKSWEEVVNVYLKLWK